MKKTPTVAAVALILGLTACASDYGYNGSGRSFRHARQADVNRDCTGRPDRDNNPPGPAGGRGTNWENPPGAAGGPGASPDRNYCR